uniref:Uncharacterized protein n=1 Tax=Timema douglasi TaxID=61478 RepID=A0A7R8VLI8_TIMDO|nr:unnamed protein product [Timema douglasi]
MVSSSGVGNGLGVGVAGVTRVGVGSGRKGFEGFKGAVVEVGVAGVVRVGIGRRAFLDGPSTERAALDATGSVTLVLEMESLSPSIPQRTPRASGLSLAYPSSLLEPWRHAHSLPFTRTYTWDRPATPRNELLRSAGTSGEIVSPPGTRPSRGVSSPRPRPVAPVPTRRTNARSPSSARTSEGRVGPEPLVPGWGEARLALLPVNFRRFPPLPSAGTPWPGPPLTSLSSPELPPKWLELPPSSFLVFPDFPLRRGLTVRNPSDTSSDPGSSRHASTGGLVLKTVPPRPRTRTSCQHVRSVRPGLSEAVGHKKFLQHFLAISGTLTSCSWRGPAGLGRIGIASDAMKGAGTVHRAEARGCTTGNPGGSASGTHASGNWRVPAGFTLADCPHLAALLALERVDLSPECDSRSPRPATRSAPGIGAAPLDSVAATGSSLPLTADPPPLATNFFLTGAGRFPGPVFFLDSSGGLLQTPTPTPFFSFTVGSIRTVNTSRRQRRSESQEHGVMKRRHTSKYRQTISAWTTVFYISSAMSALPYISYIFFGSVKEQPWNKLKVVKSNSDLNDETTMAD